MKVVYLCSQYPTLTETFIAREMQQLVWLGSQLTIGVLRPAQTAKNLPGLRVSEAREMRCNLNIIDLVQAQLWLLRENYLAFQECWQDISYGIRQWRKIFPLLYIMGVTTSFAYKLRQLGIEHIRAHFLHSEALAAMWLSRMLRVPFSLTAHTDIIHYPPALIHKAVQRAAFVAGDSVDVCDFVKRIRPEGVYLIRNGLDLDLLPVRASQATSQSPPVVLAVGTLVKKKGFDTLLLACELLSRRGVPFKCRIIGEGPERPNLQNLVKNLGLAGSVQLPGSMAFERLKEESARSALLVMPSKDSPQDRDGLPTVIIESMALGLPVVATNQAGIPELVKHNLTGLLIEPDDPPSLADAIERILTDEPLRKQLATTARGIIEREYDIQQLTHRLLSLIRSSI